MSQILYNWRHKKKSMTAVEKPLFLGRDDVVDIAHQSEVPKVEDKEYKVDDVLLDEEQILGRVEQLAAKDKERYGDQGLVVVYLADGAAKFAMDYIEAFENLGGSLVDYVSMRTSSYGNGTTSSKDPKMFLDKELDLNGRHVVVLDDIIDSGRTLQKVHNYFTEIYPTLTGQRPESVRTVAFLDKRAAREVDFHADDAGYEIPNVWVKGYGMDSRGLRSARRSISADDHYRPTAQNGLRHR